jgi:Flp pilus assembly secretin CpaC
VKYAHWGVLGWCGLLATVALAQVAVVDPQVRNRTASDGKVTVVTVAAHFVTTIRLPEPVSSVVVGDPALFQVEHNEHEPELVFVKALTKAAAETNLLISTVKGRQISILLVSEAMSVSRAKVDFLLRYKPSGGFLIEQEAVPVSLVGERASLVKNTAVESTAPGSRPLPSASVVTAGVTHGESKPESLDQLLDRQKQAPLPELYGERIEGENTKGDRLRAGISEVLDGGQQVVVLFSVVNTSKHAILLMPPQIQLGGKSKTGKVIKHDRWSTAEQLAVIDFRLTRRRVGPKERADGVVVFERPPYKQSNETLFLQMAESGAVDRPALAPIGFGVSTLREESKYEARGNSR